MWYYWDTVSKHQHRWKMIDPDGIYFQELLQILSFTDSKMKDLGIVHKSKPQQPMPVTRVNAL